MAGDGQLIVVSGALLCVKHRSSDILIHRTSYGDQSVGNSAAHLQSRPNLDKTCFVTLHGPFVVI